MFSLGGTILYILGLYQLTNGSGGRLENKADEFEESQSLDFRGKTYLYFIWRQHQCLAREKQIHLRPVSRTTALTRQCQLAGHCRMSGERWYRLAESDHFD